MRILGVSYAAAHDDFQEGFAAAGRQDLQTHVVDDEQVGFEVSGQDGSIAGMRRVRARRR
jgi:hypothetical protein